MLIQMFLIFQAGRTVYLDKAKKTSMNLDVW